MLFKRHISKREVVFASAFGAVFALANLVIQIIVYAQGTHDPSFLSDLLVAVGIFAVCLVIMIAFLKDKKKVALIATIVAMPLYGAAAFFANVNGFIDGTYAAMEFWPLGLCFIEYLVVALTVIEAFVYVIIKFVKGHGNPKFSPAQNTEVASYVLLIVEILWVIGLIHYKTYNNIFYWGTICGYIAEISMLEAFAYTLYIGEEEEAAPAEEKKPENPEVK
jgi:hypothetical protein